MAVVQTGLANSMDASVNKTRLDEVAKKLIKHKVILAEILKECVEEFREYDVSYIEKYCIMGEVDLNKIPVDQDAVDTTTDAAEMHDATDTIDADSMIVGLDTEDASNAEKTVRYDIVFDAVVPKSKDIIRLVINVEIQVDMTPGYPLITRVIYYLGRLISRQKGTVFQHSDYGKIRKVYSIWICPNPGKKRGNSLAEYGFVQKKVIGNVQEPVENYDKMSAIIITVDDDGMNSETGIIRLLSTMFSINESVEKRKEILEKEFHIPMTKELEGDMQAMCNFSDAVEYYAYQRGEEQATLSNLRNLQQTLNFSLQQAMDALRISKDDQEKYIKLLS